MHNSLSQFPFSPFGSHAVQFVQTTGSPFSSTHGSSGSPPLEDELLEDEELDELLDELLELLELELDELLLDGG